MTISHTQPWPLKFAALAAAIGLAAGIAWWTYDLGKSFAFGPHLSKEKIEMLEKRVADLTAERDKLQQDANTIDSKLNIDRSMQKQLTDQLKTLTTENQKLKDDLAFFEGFMPSGTGTEGISVQNFKIETVAPGQLKYRVLVMQGVKNGRDFVGELQFSVSFVQAGKPVTMLFPDPKTGDAGKLILSFRHYQRMDGMIALPDGVTAKSVQVKVLDRGQVRAQQAVNL